jgi:uncharacterized membrane protein YhaH (DUF805 family)
MAVHPFTSRVRRSTYALWWFLALLAAAALEDAAAGPEPVPLLPIFAVFVAVAIPTLVAAVGRLHDLDRSGWWLLLNLVPFVNLAFGIYLLVAPGTEGPNRFGPDPRGGDALSEPDEASTPASEPVQLRLVDWDGGPIRECPSCGLGNPETAYGCADCSASLAGTTPYIPSG